MSDTGTLFMPPAGSTLSSEVDSLFYFILYTAIVIFILVMGAIAFFMLKYRRKGARELTDGRDHNLKLEILWTVIPTLLVFVVFIWGFRTYIKMHVAPANAQEIKVTAQKWFWSFDYQNGYNSVNELVVPLGKPVKLLMSSQDVIHSFFVPDFRVKMDVLPNRYTQAWFEATQPGEFNIFCTEYCGKGHSEMLGKVTVLPQEEYATWIEKASADFPEGMALNEIGAKLYQSKACFTCHSVDGTISVGPSFKGVFGKTERLSDGSQNTVDENYIRESILNPQAKIVQGFQPVMPTYQGTLKDKEIDALIAYIKSLKE